MIRYIEVSYKDSKNQTQFLAAIVTTENPNEAVKQAAKIVRARHPGAHDIDEFMQRSINPNIARVIDEKMHAGEWIGWFESI